MSNITDLYSNTTAVVTLNSSVNMSVDVISDTDCDNFDIEQEYTKGFTSTRLMIIISRLGVLSAIILIGLIGNTLSFIVMWKDRAGQDGNWMLRAIAVNDNFFLIAMIFRWVVLELYFQTSMFSNLRHWYPHIFPLFYYFGRVTLASAHYTLVLATIERYMAVCKPHKCAFFKKHTRRAVVFLPLISAIIKLPQAFRWRKQDIHICSEVYAAIGIWLVKHTEYDLYEKSMYGILHTFLPILILIFCNVSMVLAVRASKKIQSTRHATTDTRLTIMLMTVVTVFLVCNLPISVVWIMEMLSDFEERNLKEFWFFALWIVLELLVVVNSGINCFVYCFIGKRFRRNLIDLFCGKEMENEVSSTFSHTEDTEFSNHM